MSLRGRVTTDVVNALLGEGSPTDRLVDLILRHLRASRMDEERHLAVAWLRYKAREEEQAAADLRRQRCRDDVVDYHRARHSALLDAAAWLAHRVYARDAPGIGHGDELL